MLSHRSRLSSDLGIGPGLQAGASYRSLESEFYARSHGHHITGPIHSSKKILHSY